jgi:hypothetical protein
MDHQSYSLQSVCELSVALRGKGGTIEEVPSRMVFVEVPDADEA